MSDIQRFDFGAHPIRVHLDEQGEPWWFATDVCTALDIKNTSQTISRLDEGEKNTICFSDTEGRPHDALIINEPGLYRVIFRSNKEAAQKFQYWVFHEVLPSIRKTGTYVHPAVSAAGNLNVLANVSQQIAGVVTDHEHRLVELERRMEERKALPATVGDVDVIRSRFAGALRSAITASGVTANMTREESAIYYQGINSKLKNQVMHGRGRANWSLENYDRAVTYLHFMHDLDLRWIFKTSEVA